ncbi:MAG: transcription termination factor Rho [Spirochaetes bacterium]|nr:transcription termination factor Rho [Spirochaetota bacterium]
MKRVPRDGGGHGDGEGRFKVKVKQREDAMPVDNAAENAEAAVKSDATEEVHLIAKSPDGKSEIDQILYISKLSALPIDKLIDMGRRYGLSIEGNIKRQDLMHSLLRMQITNGGTIYADGTLEVLPDGYGFLRSVLFNYLPGPDDIYISPSQIRLFGLRTGDVVNGQVRPPKDNERFFALLRVDTVNGKRTDEIYNRRQFDSLTPTFPNERLNVEFSPSKISTRIINLVSPIGKGQRGLIVSPPKAGKTMILQEITNAIEHNHPEVVVFVLLVDERPEEVTDMRRSVKAEVISSTFDEQAEHHVQVAEMVIEKAKRLVEHGKDVVIMLDSITRLARAYNQVVPASGKILSGGVDSNALHKPKKFFGAARNIEQGGSLTILATALVDTGSRMDELIYEEFKGTGNMELHLMRKLANRRIFPAIDINASSTRREELLLNEEELQKMWALRKYLQNMEESEVMELIIDKMQSTKDNIAFLRLLNS